MSKIRKRYFEKNKKIRILRNLYGKHSLYFLKFLSQTCTQNYYFLYAPTWYIFYLKPVGLVCDTHCINPKPNLDLF